MQSKVVLVYRNELLPLSETFIREQVAALRDWHPIMIGRKLLHQLPLPGIDVRSVEPDDSSALINLIRKFRRALGFPPFGIRQRLKTTKARLIHAHFGVDAIDAWPIAQALNVPMLVTLHGYDIATEPSWWRAGNGGARMRTYPRRLLQLAQKPQVRFIAVSEALRRRAIEVGIPGEKITTQYIGINTEKFSRGGVPIADRNERVLFVGRLVEKKGCRYLIEAMVLVQKEMPGVDLVIVGDGPLRSDLETLAKNSGVHATFLGALSNDGVKQQIDESRLLCLPSVTAKNGDSEGFGLVLLEAQAAGVPVVTSALGGSTEGISEGVTGFSFAAGDAPALAAILLRILRDNEALTRMGEAAPKFVSEKFDITRCTRQLEVVYDQVIEAALKG